MKDITNIFSQLEMAQICWVIPNIQATMDMLSNSVNIKGFPKPERMNAQDLNMSYYGEVLAAEWLTTQTYNGNIFIELVQPLSGTSMFHDYLSKYPLGGIQHMAYRLPVENFDSITTHLTEQGYDIISEVDHPIARMVFFDTYENLGIATEIMGITKEGKTSIEQMQKA